MFELPFLRIWSSYEDMLSTVAFILRRCIKWWYHFGMEEHSEELCAHWKFECVIGF